MWRHARCLHYLGLPRGFDAIAPGILYTGTFNGHVLSLGRGNDVHVSNETLQKHRKN